ncbi:MAG: glutamate-cysteine ligase family protein [Raoultibacter sp.]
MNNTAKETTFAPNTALASEAQSARQRNIDALVAYIEGGIIAAPGRVGIELEHTLIHAADRTPVTYSEDHGAQWILQQLQADYPTTTCDTAGDLLGVMRAGEAVTLEPAAQIELSAGPFASLDDAQATFAAFEEKLAALVAPFGQEVLCVGYHPSAHVKDMELIPKRRYKFMDFYLGNIGPFGPAMMRGSASTQVSIDYFSVEDCLTKLRLANVLVPLLSLVSDNAPVFEGKHRSHELVRTEIWQHCDPDRCGLIPGCLEPDFTLRDYAAYLLDTPAILMPCKKEEWCYSERSFGEIYADTTMEKSDIEHALSMLFNDVRLKTYVEIRPADAMDLPHVLAYAALIKGLFYSEENLAHYARVFADVREKDVIAAKNNLMERGYQATVYGRPAAEILDDLFASAKAGLPAAEQHYLKPLADLVAQRTTLADISAFA